jgi:hypothetical protein
MKSKATPIEKYIQSRRDLHCDPSKIKDLSEYLANKLDQFLKNTVEEIYDIACLKNRKNPKFGNELGFFADEHGRVSDTQEFYFK